MQQPYPAPVRPGPTPAARQRIRLPRNPLMLALIGGGAALMMALSVAVALGMGALLVYSSGRILPGVSVGGIALGGQTAEEAAATLAAAWSEITIRDGDRQWRVAPAYLGVMFDSAASAAAAVRYGRGDGSPLAAFIGPARVAPVFAVDTGLVWQGVEALSHAVDLPARNATIRFENGGLVPVPAEPGRQLIIPDTAARVADFGAEMADGAFDLAMAPVLPTVTDASALLAQTAALLALPLTLNGWNPVTDETAIWQVSPDVWGGWLTTENGPSGVQLALDGGALAGFLSARNAELGEARYLNVEEAARAAQQAIGAGTPSATVRIYNRPTRYTVAPGDTLGTISWRSGIQMYRIARANPGINTDALAPGQVITIPSRDELLPLPVVPGKRIVISISRQRMWVYENGQVRWEWPASTGIASSPTMPGIYQVTSHDGTAYASNWNLHMPYFMSIYEAVPGFYNGIHGFPWRSGSQILWESALGRPVTYGCILISTQNARLLYEWAQDGVVTEIQP
jgi:lipoprotein-anchoring transpeptidase ErfK/SrfK